MKDKKNPKIVSPSSEFTTHREDHHSRLDESVSKGKSCYVKGNQNGKKD